MFVKALLRIPFCFRMESEGHHNLLRASDFAAQVGILSKSVPKGNSRLDDLMHLLSQKDVCYPKEVILLCVVEGTIT